MNKASSGTVAAPNLLETLGLSSFSPPEQEEMLLTLSDLIFRGSLVRLVERMDDQTRLDFSVMCVKGATNEDMATFIKERVPDADAVVRETIDELAADVAALNIPAAA
jgi:hypothetical protein